MKALILAMLMIGSAGMAQEPDTAPLAPNQPPGPVIFGKSSSNLSSAASVASYPGSGSNVGIALYLTLLLALFAGGAYLVKNGFGIFQPRPKGERKLSIEETRMLGGRQFLVVANYEGRKVLLGVCPGRIDYLCPLSDGEAQFPSISPEKSDA